jgi:hypothetical protein
MTTESPNFKCPKIDCSAQYVSVRRDCAPAEKPRCAECGTPFLVMDDVAGYLHYERV